ncbi:alpha/beta fold hydrolase [Embleya sp. NPDC056575]|uniref:alpha/beta fold hydrolase n=1 Tax=unclassified Embleya TaxID=2699296 RepID=UPI003696C150
MTISAPPTRFAPAPGGRRIAYCVYGDPTGVPTIVAHGTPGSRFQAHTLDASAAAAGVRLICPDRPGFGETDPVDIDDFHAWDGDFTALLDALELDRASLIGISGGAGYALAVAQRVPDRVERLVVACGMVPGAPASAARGRLPVVTLAYWLARRVPGLLGVLLTRRASAPTDPAKPPAGLPESDRLALNDPAIRASTARDAEAALCQGPGAAVADMRRYHRALPDPLGTITAPTTIVHGDLDANVPVGVARWLHARLPAAELHILPEAGHLFALTDPAPLWHALLD